MKAEPTNEPSPQETKAALADELCAVLCQLAPSYRGQISLKVSRTELAKIEEALRLQLITEPTDPGYIPDKFIVTRSDGSSLPSGKHAHCEHFVLDLNHDQDARAALREYIHQIRHTKPRLAADLITRLRRVIPNPAESGEPYL